MADFLSTNILKEAASSLELTEENLLLVEADVYRWKWVIIATHNSLQNIMVASLRHGNGFHSMTNDSFKKWMIAYRGNQPLPPTKLASFLDLYKRIKKKRIMECYVFSKSFSAEQHHTESIKKLNTIRNRFIHFEIDIWSLELAGLPRICLSCFDIMRFLVCESDNIMGHKPEELGRLKESISNVITHLQKLDG